jgi:DNA-binding NtrC family response regulator
VLGSSESRTLDVRIIAATNRDLQAAVREGSFREDLLYRLNLISVHLPALADRRADIPLLAAHFLKRAATIYHKPDLVLDDAALRWLQNQDWPGNVRQLEQVIQRAVLVTDTDRLGAEHFKRTQEISSPPERDRLPPVGSMTMEDIEQSMIRKALAHHEGNISRTAEDLGFSRAALYRRLEKYGIEV